MAEAPFIPAARPLVGDDEAAAVLRVLKSGMLAQGPEVAAFEQEFSTLVGDRRCVAVNSGTSALHLALLAMGIRRGDEVLVPSFTFAASANSIAIIGAVPVFVDIDPDTFCMDPAAAEAAITDRTRAVMPVHLYGHPAAMDAIMANLTFAANGSLPSEWLALAEFRGVREGGSHPLCDPQARAASRSATRCRRRRPDRIATGGP